MNVADEWAELAKDHTEWGDHTQKDTIFSLLYEAPSSKSSDVSI